MPNKAINLDPLTYRITSLVIGTVVVALLLVSSIWFFGDAIAGNADSLELAELAQSMSPGNPKPHLVKSLIREKSFGDEELKIALDEAETATSFAPYDFMMWQTVARLRERSGDIVGAEAALRRAHFLAPKFSTVDWALGNVLLRQRKYEEAFKLIRRTVEGEPKYAAPAAAIAWDIYDGEISSVEKSIGKSPQVRSALAVYLAKQGRFSESIRFWKSIDSKDRRDLFANQAKQLIAVLNKDKKYRLSLEVIPDLTEQGKPVPKVGKITNGGFEDAIARQKAGLFEWSIAEGKSPSIGVSVDSKTSGKKSLAILFDGSPVKTFRSVTQLIAGESGRTYTFSLKYRSRTETDSTLFWQIRDSISNVVLASTEPISTNSDWATQSVDFTVPEDSHGVNVRLLRSKCPTNTCPISGTVWFDDIEVN